MSETSSPRGRSASTVIELANIVSPERVMEIYKYHLSPRLGFRIRRIERQIFAWYALDKIAA